MKYPFKVGELVEQTVDTLLPHESPLCRVVAIEKNNGFIRIKHKHRERVFCTYASLSCFRKLPKLRRLLKYGVHGVE